MEFTYPSSSELIEIEQVKLPRLVEDDPIFKLFPMVSVDTHLLKWEQLDNYVGLQGIRGLNGQPSRVRKTGLRQFQMQPGVYGEFEIIDEEELTIRRKIGDNSMSPVSIDDLVMMAQDKLLQRRLDRIRWILWTLLTTGTFAISAPGGGVMHTDEYDLQTGDGSTWDSWAESTPLADLRAVQLLARGASVSFGAGAIAFMNRQTANDLMSNTNDEDLGGKLVGGGNTINELADVNRILLANDLPEVVVHDEGYLDENGDFQLFIPDETVVIVGKRVSGVSLGEYRFTRNANNPSLGPGPYTRVIDRGEQHVPRTIEVHDGHNGGPAIFFPGGVVILDVS